MTSQNEHIEKHSLNTKAEYILINTTVSSDSVDSSSKRLIQLLELNKI